MKTIQLFFSISIVMLLFFKVLRCFRRVFDLVACEELKKNYGLRSHFESNIQFASSLKHFIINCLVS
jgi:hypothetical protein